MFRDTVSAFFLYGWGFAGHVACADHHGGVEIAPTQWVEAEARRGDVPGLNFRTAEAADFLTDHPSSFEVVLSTFGPVWFTDPVALLPLVRRSLASGGVFAFSRSPAGPDERAELSSSARFTNITVDIIDPPNGEPVGTLVVARRDVMGGEAGPAQAARALVREAKPLGRWVRGWSGNRTGVQGDLNSHLGLQPFRLLTYGNTDLKRLSRPS
ncbi:hypothetical protein [Streptomyces sp. URMC 124]|uniref:hypothetical protein n=1 Tax=Streptomyces sp. URMC 124 TaxID=3423405 RepID=UPI003F1BD35A